MTRLDRYVLREALLPFMAGVVGFVAVILINTIINSTSAILTQNVSVWVILRWLCYRVPIVMTFALPVGCMLGTSLLVVRMGRDNELAPWRLGGVSLRRIFRPLLWAGLLVSLLALLNSEYLAPKFRTKAARLLIDHSLMGPGSAVKPDLPFRAGDDSFVHVGRVDLQREEMYFVLIYQLREGRPVETLCAQKAVKREGRWELRDGQRNTFDAAGHLLRSAPFQSEPVEFAADLAEIWEDVTEPEHLPASELRRRLRQYEAVGDKLNAVEARYYLHAKYAVALTSFVFVLLAAPVSLPFARPRSNPMAGLLVTVVVIFFCNGTINWAKAICIGGPEPWLPPPLAAWLHVLVFGGLGALLLRKVDWFEG